AAAMVLPLTMRAMTAGSYITIGIRRGTSPDKRAGAGERSAAFPQAEVLKPSTSRRLCSRLYTRRTDGLANSASITVTHWPEIEAAAFVVNLFDPDRAALQPRQLPPSLISRTVTPRYPGGVCNWQRSDIVIGRLQSKSGYPVF